MHLRDCLFAVCFLVSVFVMFTVWLTPSLSRSKPNAHRIQSDSLDEVQAALEHDVFCPLNFDDQLISKAIYPGNTSRLKNVLGKALGGKDIKVVVLGGSNSAGGYLGADEKNLDGLYFKVFTSWWNKYITKVTKAFMKELQLAIGATGSYFYAYCYKTFIAEDEKIDIVLIEVSVNDGDKTEPLEQLTRLVLMHPSEPAILYVNLVHHLDTSNPSCINLESFGQTEIAHHYEIASISLRNLLCRQENGQWRAVVKNTTASDGNHVDVNAHALIATMMIKYVRRVFKELINDINNNFDNLEDKGTNLPKLLFIKRQTEALRQPLCWTGKTPVVSKIVHRPNLQLKIVDNNGFSMCLELKNITKPLRPDATGGWCAKRRFSNLTLSIFLPADPNFKELSTLARSVTVLVINRGGNAAVWLDNNENNAVKFRRAYGSDQFDTIATRVKPGYHYLTVRTLKKGMFMVAGVFVGPPDFQLRVP